VSRRVAERDRDPPGQVTRSGPSPITQIGPLGKPVGADIRSGVLTMPSLLEMAGPTGGDLRALLLRRQAADLEQASRMIIQSGRIDEVIDVARQFAAQASAAISHLPTATSLSRFPPSYVDWALEEFVTA